MSQDDRAEVWSDCDENEPANSSSLNSSSHSEEEFSIQSSAQGEFDLKFKISCLKKASSNGAQTSPRADLMTDISQNEKVQPSSQQDGNMDSQKSLYREPLPVASLWPQEVKHQIPGDSAQSGHCKSELGQSRDDIVPNRDNDWKAKNSDPEAFTARLEEHLEVKTIKVGSKACSGSRSSAADAPDACYRMDALPNVSPDSGIVSFEGSPFGNESPNSVAGMEHHHEAQSSLSAPMNVQQGSDKCIVDCHAMGKCDSNGTLTLVSQSTKEGEIVSEFVQNRVVLESPSIESTEDKSGPPNSNESRKSSETGDVVAMEPSGQNSSQTVEQQHSRVPSASEQDEALAAPLPGEGLAASDQPSSEQLPKEPDCSTVNIILSSPDKISQINQPTWRKKREKKQRRRKKLLLTHKKSRLYNVGENKSSMARGSSKGQNLHDSSKSTDASVDSNKTAQELMQDDRNPLDLQKNNTNKLLMRKKSPGRPKGSLNRRLEENILRGTFRRPVVKPRIDESPLKPVEIPQKAISAAATSSDKRPRGRPRKCPLSSEGNLSPPVSKPKIVKRKRTRKRLFTHMKKTAFVKQIADEKQTNVKSERKILDKAVTCEKQSKAKFRKTNLLEKEDTCGQPFTSKSQRTTLQDKQVAFERPTPAKFQKITMQDKYPVSEKQRSAKYQKTKQWDNQTLCEKKLNGMPQKPTQQDYAESTYSNTSSRSISESNAPTQQLTSKGNINTPVKPLLKKNKEVETNDSTKVEPGDNDLYALLQSVNRSINKQFIADEDNNEMISSLSFDNPFKSVQTPSFPHLTPTSDGNLPMKSNKPKYKRPKLHVMMRKTKRRKKKKNLEMSRTSAFGVSSPEKRLSFFSSCFQPPKILASSRLNVFQSGTGVDANRAATPSESELQECSDKRFRRKKRLLNFKSKHKNIIDPVFAADLDVMVSGLHDMAISEDSNDNFIKVRPGEMPLPTIFRVIKIDVSKRHKDKMFPLEPMPVDASKAVKVSKKEQPGLEATVSSFAQFSGKSARKKSLSDQAASDSKDQLSLSDASDQWLPPKKRHRLVNIEGAAPLSPPPMTTSDSALSTTGKDDYSSLGEKKKGRRLKKSSGFDVPKQGGLGWKNMEQELTIDTSSWSGRSSSVGAQTPSPCLSRLSTRSSTIPLSISSLSPTGSGSFRSRSFSKTALLACPMHSLSLASQDDCLSCAECQLIRQSSATTSPGDAMRTANPTLQRSLSAQLTVEPSMCLSEHARDSSSESSPNYRLPRSKEYTFRRTQRKRCKSSAYSAEESDPSPPRLDKSCAISFPSVDADTSALPPKISPAKDLPSSPQKRSGHRRLKSSAKSRRVRTASSQSKSSVSAHQPLRQSSLGSLIVPSDNDSPPPCNTTPAKPPHSLLTSPNLLPVIDDHDPDSSEWQPLPLKHCSRRKLVEEIQAALQSDSSDSDSSLEEDEPEQPVSYPSISSQGSATVQPPRKRYQRVGLFSDFYKDDEPRRRCESSVRCRDKLAYVREEHEHGLMPLPVHIGQHYMRQVSHFKLPYDIWWLDLHQQLPKKLEPKIKFRTIKSNVYSDSKVNSRKVEHPMCSCKLPPNGGNGCLDECLNRMIYTECSPTNCPLGSNCSNQRIQKHEWAPGIEKFLTADRGYGVRATKLVKSGQFLLEYLGEVVSETEFRRRMMEEYSEECHHYALHLDSGTIIDGYRVGNIGRYVNHSCQPNCEMQKWNVNGLYRMVLFALRDIQPFEELVYDYNFDAFNQETQQECRCGSEECRGVIGGKTQRSGGVGRLERADETKDKRKSKLMNKKTKEKKQPAEAMPVLPPTKPMTFKERGYARKHRIFLVRNVDKVRNQRHPGQVLPTPKEEVGLAPKVNCVTSDVLLANLSESSVKTRLAALAKDNPEVLRRHRLAQLFDRMLTELLSLKDDEGNCMVTPLLSLPSRKKQLEYYKIVKEPIDLSMIKQRVKTGFYHHLSSFNADVMLLFTNVELYCGHKSELGQVILKLRRIFNCVKQEMAGQLDEEMGPGTTRVLLDTDLEKLEQAAIKPVKQPDEDIIRCICGVTRDEGLMLQCEKCMKWQHCDCVRASGEEEHYLCDRCEPRYYDPEIPLPPRVSDSMPDCTLYMTLAKDDVQYAVGDCVYVMRDCKRTASGAPLRSSHRLMATTNPDSLDIFRIDKLWKDPKGERFASGTPYLRPQETFHEPTRKFFHNELFRTPSFEIIPLELVMGKCVVMDPNTYSKGRPKGVKEQDVYICEYRVDKTAHLFHKIKEIWYPINTSRFCFDRFDSKLSLKRTYTPHEVPEEYIRRPERGFEGVGPGKVGDAKEWPDRKADVKKPGKHQLGKVKVDESLQHDFKLKAEVKVNVKKGSLLKGQLKQECDSVEKPDVARLMAHKRQEKRQRLDRLLNKLLQNIPGKQKIDLSYLLDGGRRIRKKLVK